MADHDCHHDLGLYRDFSLYLDLSVYLCLYLDLVDPFLFPASLLLVLCFCLVLSPNLGLLQTLFCFSYVMEGKDVVLNVA